MGGKRGSCMPSKCVEVTGKLKGINSFSIIWVLKIKLRPASLTARVFITNIQEFINRKWETWKMNLLYKLNI